MIRTIKVNIPTKDELLSNLYRVRLRFINLYYQLDKWAFHKGGVGFWRMMYRLTGRCGSILEGHTPIFNNPKLWLWEYRTGTYTCSVCYERVLVKVGHGSYKNYHRRGREEDVKELLEMRDRAEHDSERLSIDKAIYNINHEEKHTRDMRESLIKATREHEHDKIQDIHEYVGEKKKYRREVV